MTTRKSWGGPHGIARALPTVTQAALRRRGFAESEVVLRWPAIVGEHLAARCTPEKLAFRRGDVGGGVLHLRVDPAAAPEIQHLTPLILERINIYYGFRAVSRLQLIQAPAKRRYGPASAPLRPLTAAERASLAQQLAATPDDRLREALRGLGESVLGRRPAT